MTVRLSDAIRQLEHPDIDESWDYRLPEEYREDTVVEGQPAPSSAALHHSRPSLRRALEQLNAGTTSLRVP